MRNSGKRFYAFILSHARIHARTHTRTRARTHTHTHIHTQSCGRQRRLRSRGGQVGVGAGGWVTAASDGVRRTRDPSPFVLELLELEQMCMCKVLESCMPCGQLGQKKCCARARIFFAVHRNNLCAVSNRAHFLLCCAMRVARAYMMPRSSVHLKLLRWHH